ncbi:hypothetical protein J6590_104124 [Homalodisca vitripennis]|nr:hypothetical protein J6590_104124 [Homalodisca vitripennis]
MRPVPHGIPRNSHNWEAPIATAFVVEEDIVALSSSKLSIQSRTQFCFTLPNSSLNARFIFMDIKDAQKKID